MMPTDAQNTLGTSYALLEAEAAWFVSQGHPPETVALWIDEPVAFVLNAVASPETGTWYVYNYDRWQRRIARVKTGEMVMTPAQIDKRAAAVREKNMRTRESRRTYSDKQILKAMKAGRGKAKLAAKRLGCHLATVYERLNGMRMAKAVPIDSHR